METEKAFIEWHKATESPGKRAVCMLCKHGGHKHLVAHYVRFLSPEVIPAQVDMGLDAKGQQQLPVAWAYIDEVSKVIPKQFIAEAENAAWAWYKKPNKE